MSRGWYSIFPHAKCCIIESPSARKKLTPSVPSPKVSTYDKSLFGAKGHQIFPCLQTLIAPFFSSILKFHNPLPRSTYPSIPYISRFLTRFLMCSALGYKCWSGSHRHILLLFFLFFPNAPRPLLEIHMSLSCHKNSYWSEICTVRQIPFSVPQV